MRRAPFDVAQGDPSGSRGSAAATLIVAALVASVSSQSEAVIRITAGRAEIRPEPGSPVMFGQVAEGTYLILIKEVGDWYQVQFPPDPRRPGVRMLGFVSKKLAVKVTGAEAAKAREAANRPPSPKPPGDTITIGAEVTGQTTWLKAQATRAVWIPDASATIAVAASSEALATALAAGSGPNPAIPGVNDVTWVWVTAATSLPRVASRRPSFYVSYGEVPGLDSREWAPYVVRLTPAGEWRVVTALPGPSLAANHSQRHWEIRRTIVQNEMAGSIAGLADGIVRLTLTSPLAPGEYAVVIRPAFARRAYAGRDVLSAYGPGAAFGAAWLFAVK